MSRRTGLVLALLLAACGDAGPGTRAGESFAALSLPTLGGEAALALPLAGSVTVVNVWATWCEPCRREMASLEALHRAAPAGVRVVGVSVDDDPIAAEEFVRRLRLTFPNVQADVRRLSALPLAVRRFPTTFVVDARGVVRWREVGARDWSSRDTAERLAAVLAP